MAIIGESGTAPQHAKNGYKGFGFTIFDTKESALAAYDGYDVILVQTLSMQEYATEIEFYPMLNISHCPDVETDFMAIVSSCVMEQKVKIHLSRLLLSMLNAQTEEKGWRLRSELQGFTSCLQVLDEISEQEHDDLGKAIGNLWKPLARKFAVTRLSEAK